MKLRIKFQKADSVENKKTYALLIVQHENAKKSVLSIAYTMAPTKSGPTVSLTSTLTNWPTLAVPEFISVKLSTPGACP